MDGISDEEVNVASEVIQQPTPPPSDSQVGGDIIEAHSNVQSKRMDIDDEAPAVDMLSPMSTEVEKSDENDIPVLSTTHIGLHSMGYDFSNIRVCVFSGTSNKYRITNVTTV